MKKVLIVGAGLAGSLLAGVMAKRGYSVKLVERRSDPRLDQEEGGRSINLALSDRGLLGLSLLGLDEKLQDFILPMKGRLIHTRDGRKELQPYSGKIGEHINSVSRAGLNRRMLNDCQDLPGMEMIFDAQCISADIRNAQATFLDTKSGNEFTEQADFMIGTDGAFSQIRLAMQTGGVPRFNFSQDYLEHGYKEIEMPPRPGGGHKIENNALHIWPRKGYMMIALPNLDGSFTCTLFMPFGGENGFDNLDSLEKVSQFAKKNFPDAYELIPDFAEQYFDNPTGALATMRCEPWNYKGKTLLIGDSAHAVVPFYGQGMNASFEDVYYFDKLMEANNGNTEKVFPEFSKMRKPNADAIATLAIQNYVEMRASTADPLYQEKRELEIELERDFEQYSSKYNLVTFREDIGYSTALKMGQLQDRFLLEMISQNGGSQEGIPRNQIIAAIEKLWQDNMK